MGMSKDSMGIKSVDSELIIQKINPDDKVIALAGNPNVGKSTVFNQLTGLNQHTGNWPGKTVTNAQGYCSRNGKGYVMVDIPGCYSLMAHSAEEEVARDFICFEQPDAVIVICDATCLERNMNLVLQITEAARNVIVCVNLMDEAEKKKIRINIAALQESLGIPVLGITARSNQGLENIFESLEVLFSKSKAPDVCVAYEQPIENAISMLEPVLKEHLSDKDNVRWFCARLLDADGCLLARINDYLGFDIMKRHDTVNALFDAREYLASQGFDNGRIHDSIASSFIKKAEEICHDYVSFEDASYDRRDRRLDRLFTSRLTGFPIMFFVLLGIFWLTITGANYPSMYLSSLLFKIEDWLALMLSYTFIPDVICDALIFGVYRVLAWVISVMLPPMAIFFPLFTLLEDFGYLPRVAFNLDRCFKRCCTCGKQALTMCMGFGCNAAGIIGCRIIDSPRERLIAIITNSFVPCNGRFPTLIAIITMFFISSSHSIMSSFLPAFLLAIVIVLGIVTTLIISKLLSMTILKGMPSSFTLELPPYRRPQLCRVLVRSVFDRTLFVLSRAVIVAAPAGLLIWLMANVNINGITLLAHCSGFLDPFARLIGLDGVILLAFILGFPANEIVVPIIIMAYMAEGSLLEINDLNVLKTLLTDNGWTWITAVNTILFSLMHWPCSTTCLTIKKETQSLKWTLISFIIPTIAGISACFLFTFIARGMQLH